MAKATTKASSLTTLKIGNVEVPVGLFSAVAAPSKLADFETAGPNGGRLKAEFRARPVPVLEARDEGEDVPVGSSDPFADEPGWAAGDVAAVLGEEFSPDPERHAPTFPPGDEPAPVKPDTDWPGAPPVLDAARPPAVSDPDPTHGQVVVDGEYGRVLVEDGTGVEVLPHEVRRGVRLEDGRFIDCTARLAQIEQDTKLDRMEVVGFVDSTQVPRTRVKATQYVGAGDEKAPRALRIMYEALKRTRRMAVVKLTKRTRQTLGVIGVSRGCLVLLELVWAEDFREPPARAKRIQKESVTEREVSMFAELVRAMAVPISELDGLRDDAIACREELRAQAERGEVTEILELVDAEVIEPADEILAQLEASLAAASS